MQKAVFITGAARRIGQSLALYFAQQGYAVGLHYNRSSEAAEETAAQIVAASGQSCKTFQADLSNLEAVAPLMEQVKDVLPGLCLLINNASVFERSSMADTSIDLYKRHMDIHAAAPFFLIQAFGKAVKEGHIINIVDTKAAKRRSVYAAYTLSKKALVDLTLMAAAEYAPRIRVNAIAPGFILPPEGTAHEPAETLLEHIPMKAQGSIDDICRAAWYLEKSPFCTGQILYADGGQHL